MSAYDSDPRVTRVSDDRYDLPSPEGWHVDIHPSGSAFVWADDYGTANGTWYDTADQAICSVIGAPQ